MLRYSSRVSHRRNASARRSRALAVVSAGALCLGLVACSPEPMPVPTATPSATETPAPRGDGVLTIGTLFPTTGSSSPLARAQEAGVELAVREINEAGGVNGQAVAVYHRDSGDAAAEKAEESLADLAEKKVDVIIGPSSSAIAERILPKVVDAGMVMISPSATSPALSVLPDEGRLFRTVSSAALQGSALAQLTGAKRTLALIFYSDAPARALRETLVSGLEAIGSELVVDEAFTETTNSVDRIVVAVKRADPDLVVLASPSGTTAKNEEILLRLAAEKLAGSRLWLTAQNLVDYSKALPAGTLDGVNGLLEGTEAGPDFARRVKSADPSVGSIRFAAEAYDATILAALAAIVAGDDSGAAIARSLREVSSGGIGCTTFGECLDVLRTMPDIDYVGVSGSLDLDEQGDVHPAVFGLYRYDAANRYRAVGTIAVR